MSIFASSGRLPVLVGILAGWGMICEVSAQETNAPPSAAPRLPSVVMIVADGLGCGELGCYGQKEIRTPRIDEVAAGGLRFTDSYAGAASETSARVALMSGILSGSALAPDTPTLAEHLKRAGYHTGYIGYWGLGGFRSSNSAQQRGFDEVVVYGDRRHAHDLYTGYLYRKDPHTGFEDSIALAGNPPGQKTTYLPDLLTQAAIKLCRQNKPERLNGWRPFLVVVSYPVPAAVSAGSGSIPESRDYAGKPWPDHVRARANAITRLDEHIGNILDELQKRGLAQNTIVLVTSSLGPEVASAPVAPEASGLAEGRLRVPLVVQWPFWMRSGATSDLLVSGADLVPTLLDAARLEVPEVIGGISFLPTLRGQEQTNRHAQLQWSMVDSDGASHEAVRRGQWKAVRHGADQPWLLFDLHADPGEQHDLASQHPERVKALSALLDSATQAPSEASVAGPEAQGSDGKRE